MLYLQLFTSQSRSVKVISKIRSQNRKIQFKLLREQFSFNGTITIGEPVRVTKHGHDFGLMVLINQRTDDYAFSINSNIGCRILIFDTRNFPDNISGAIKEKFLSIGEEMFLSINARPNVGSNGLRKYSKELRNCVFSDEISLIYEKYAYKSILGVLIVIISIVFTLWANVCWRVAWLTLVVFVAAFHRSSWTLSQMRICVCLTICHVWHVGS